MMVPESLAYATIAGVSPVVGLYAAPGALVFYAALGSSRQLVTGPSAAAAALSAAVVGEAIGGRGDQFAVAIAALAICVGGVAIVAGLLRLGFLANFISEPVLKGFIVGLSLTILIGQAPKLFGVEGGDGDFFQQLWDLVRHLGDTDLTTLVVGAGSLAALLGLRRVDRRIPAALIVVFIAIGAVEVLSLDSHGVAVVGSIESGLPSFGVPDLSISGYGSLAGGAVGVMLVGFAEALGAAKTYAAKERATIDVDRELIGLGAANLGAGLSSGLPVNGSLSKTAINAAAGGRTQLAGLVAAAVTLLTLLFFTGLFESLPEATLAAVVIAALIDLVDFPALAELYRVYTRRLGNDYGLAARPDFIAAVVAMLGVMVLDTLPGLFLGIGVALLLLLYRASRPHVATLGRVAADGRFEDVDRHPEARPVPGVVAMRIESGLFFANADSVRARIAAAAGEEGVRVVVLDFESVPFLDVSAARMLAAVGEDLRRDGIELRIARADGQVRDVLDTAVPPPPPTYPTIAAAAS
jgi:high affinity sulfate transporter 1